VDRRGQGTALGLSCIHPVGREGLDTPALMNPEEHVVEAREKLRVAPTLKGGLKGVLELQQSLDR
jgi:hypothetical protein